MHTTDIICYYKYKFNYVTTLKCVNNIMTIIHHRLYIIIILCYNIIVLMFSLLCFIITCTLYTSQYRSIKI